MQLENGWTVHYFCDDLGPSAADCLDQAMQFVAESIVRQLE